MGRLRQWLLEGYGEFSVSEGLSPAQISSVYHNIVANQKNLLTISKSITNHKWKAYIADYIQRSVNVADLLSRLL